MDPISFTASVLTVLEAATVLGKAAIALYRGLHGASEELEWVASRILQMRLQLDMTLRLHERQLRIVENNNDDDDINDTLASLLQIGDFASLRESLTKGRECVEKIEQALETSSGRHRSLKWVLGHKHLIAKLLGHLRDIESGLSMVLLVINASISSASYMSITDIASKQDVLLQRLRQHEDVQIRATGQRPNSWVTRRPSVHPSTPRIWKRLPASEDPTDEPVGSFGLVSSHGNEFRSISDVSFFWRLPSVLNGVVVKICARISWLGKQWPSLTYSVHIKNIVPSDSAIMRACDSGDVEQVRKILTLGQGGPSDIDEAGRSVLYRAIKSGSYDLVRLLLDAGSCADVVDERCQESALQISCRKGLIDIGRLLLARGACVEHVDLGGGTALASLWMEPALSFSRVEFVQAMCASCTPPLQSLDGEFIDPLNCVAMQGSGEEIELLATLGRDLSRRDCYGDLAIKYCILGSNQSTYDSVVPWMPPGWIHQTDGRGQTFLHTALQCPGPNTTRILERLLRAGADVHARDAQGNLPEHIARFIDDEMESISAWREGQCRNFDAYLRALRSCGFQIEAGTEGDLFWSVEEYTINV